MGGLLFGYQFNEDWSTDVSLGTDFSGEVDTDQYALNVYRSFGDSKWKPFVSGGVSSFDIPDALNGDESTTQGQIGIELQRRA